jgi:hypothetical protein
MWDGLASQGRFFMRRFLALTALVLFAATAAATAQAPGTRPPPLVLSSPAYADGGVIPAIGR